MSKLDDLILKAKQGDMQAKEEILDKYRPYILKRCSCTYVKGYSFFDLLQEGNKSILQAIKLYNRENCFTTYVINAINNNYNYLIRSSIQKFEYDLDKILCDDLSFLDLESTDFNLEDSLCEKELVVLLYKAIDKLGPKEKDIIIGIYLKGLNIKEYALKNNMKYSTCFKLKKLAIDKLRIILDNLYN